MSKKKKIKTKALAVRKNLDLDPAALTKSRVELIKRTVAVGSTDDELKMFLQICQRTGLDPFARQIYLIQRGEGDKHRAVVQTGIDGFRSVAERSGSYAGSDVPKFTYADPKATKQPVSAEVTIYRIVQGQRVSTSSIGYWDEYYPGDKLGFMWRKMPHVMLAKCVEANALRKAFPQVLGGVYVVEELSQHRMPDEVSQGKRDVAGSTSKFSRTIDEVIFDVKEKIAAARTEAVLNALGNAIIKAKSFTRETKDLLTGLIMNRLSELKNVKG